MSASKKANSSRSEPNYPYYDLDSAIQFSAHIRTIGGSRGEVKKSSLAKDLKIAESTPSFFQRLAAAKTFGLIEGWGTYSLTDLGRSFFYPQTENESKDSLLKALATPKAFNFLLNRFDGDRLPSTEIIGNIVHHECGVPPSWKDRVAQIFVRSASYCGIIDSGEILRYDASMLKPSDQTPNSIDHIIDTTTQAADSPGAVSEQLWRGTPTPSVPKQKISTPVSTWSYNFKGMNLRLETPEELPFELWDKLNAYVQLLKPSSE